MDPFVPADVPASVVDEIADFAVFGDGFADGAGVKRAVFAGPALGELGVWGE